VAINGIPRVALAPLFVVWFGIGLLPKIVLVFTLVFFVIFYNTYSGVRSVESHYLDLARVMGANDRVMFHKVILPAAMPYIFLGIKLSIPYALIGAIIGEFVASSAGLGWKIQVETSLYNTTGTMAGLVVLMAIVMVMNWGLDHMERHLLAWRPRQKTLGAEI
jgi:NitT/TauT family transport system permease protein